MIEILILTLLSLVFGLLLGYAAVKYKVEGNPLVDKINNLLPQTQCGQCDYPGCKPYATALAEDTAEINLCIPGGATTVVELADLLGKEVKEVAVEKPASYVIIREEDCIGCTLCIQACPVDAIVGAAKLMHVVIIDDCTGCDLCLPPCPVDCIDIIPIETTLETWIPSRPSRIKGVVDV